MRERCLTVPTLRHEPPRESDPLARLFELGVARLDRGGTVGDVEAIGVGLDSALDQCVELAAARLLDGHVSPGREISPGGRQDAGAGRGRGILGTGETAVKDGSARHGTRALRGQAVGPGPPWTRVTLWERYVPLLGASLQRRDLLEMRPRPPAGTRTSGESSGSWTRSRRVPQEGQWSQFGSTRRSHFRQVVAIECPQCGQK